MTAGARALLAVCSLAIGCGRSENDSEPPRPGLAGEVDAVSSVRVELTEAAEPGGDASDGRRVTGSVRFAGRPPLRRPIAPIARTAGCLEHGDPPRTEDVVVTDGALRDVVVLLRRVPAGVEVPALASADDARMDQAGCVFVPHVVALRTGARLEVANSDAVAHNVRLVSDRNPTVNRTIGPGGAPIALELPRPDRARLACDLHPWMSAWVVSVDHPWFAVTGVDGTFVLPDLPPDPTPGGSSARLEVLAWHPVLGELVTEPFDLPGGGAATVEFTFAGAPARDR